MIDLPIKQETPKPELMSGQEWHNRFWRAIEELKGNYPALETDMYDNDHIVHAARRAAGIEEKYDD